MPSTLSSTSFQRGPQECGSRPECAAAMANGMKRPVPRIGSLDHWCCLQRSVSAWCMAAPPDKRTTDKGDPKRRTRESSTVGAITSALSEQIGSPPVWIRVRLPGVWSQAPAGIETLINGPQRRATTERHEIRSAVKRARGSGSGAPSAVQFGKTAARCWKPEATDSRHRIPVSSWSVP